METSDDESNSSSEEVNEDIPTVKEVELDHVIRLSAWSPSMDIFAVAYEENNEVELFHMNLKSLWVLQNDCKPTSLSWRPDGTALAVGFVNGSIGLVDTETGELATSSLKHSSPVELLYWHSADEWRKDKSGGGGGSHGTSSSSSTNGGEGFPLLCSCDEKFTMQVSAHGLLPLVKVDLSAQLSSVAGLDSPGVKPLAISANTSFTRVLLTFSYEEPSSGSKSIKCGVLDVSAVSNMKRDIWRWADYISELERHVSKLKATLKSLRPHLSFLDQNYPYVIGGRKQTGAFEDGWGGGDFGGSEMGNSSKYQMTHAKLSKSLLLGYSSVANSMVAQKSCKSSALELDKSIAKLYQILTYEFLPSLESAYQHLQGHHFAFEVEEGSDLFFNEKEKNSLQEILQHVTKAIGLAQSLQPKILTCSRQGREFFSWLHSSQLSLDKEELPHSQIKALLQSHRICGALVEQEGEEEDGEGRASSNPASTCSFMDWKGLHSTLEDFQEEIFSATFAFSNCILIPCKLFSKKLGMDLMDEIEHTKNNEEEVCTFVDLVSPEDGDGRETEEGEGEGEEEKEDFWNVVTYAKNSGTAKLYTVSASLGLKTTKKLNFGFGEKISQFSFYKWPYLGWIIHSHSHPVHAGTRSSIVIMSREDCTMQENHIDTTREGSLRSKDLGNIQVSTFAVSKNRATAYTQDGDKSVVVFDLEDDE